jgi:hypothetical protein
MYGVGAPVSQYETSVTMSTQALPATLSVFISDASHNRDQVLAIAAMFDRVGVRVCVAQRPAGD